MEKGCAQSRGSYGKGTWHTHLERLLMKPRRCCASTYGKRSLSWLCAHSSTTELEVRERHRLGRHHRAGGELDERQIVGARVVSAREHGGCVRIGVWGHPIAEVPYGVRVKPHKEVEMEGSAHVRLPSALGAATREVARISSARVGGAGRRHTTFANAVELSSTQPLVETIFTSIAGCRQMCRAQTPLAVFAAYARTKNVLVGCDRTATQPPHVVL